MEQLIKTKINDHIYRFEEITDSDSVDAYLVIGSEKAIMIDGLTVVHGLLDAAKAVTDRPLEMIIAHGHIDHAGQGAIEFVNEGLPVYMSEKDKDVCHSMVPALDISKLLPLDDGMLFELGDITLKAIAVPGHTQGEFVIYDSKDNFMFSSDAFGSGNIWMWLDHSSTLTEFESALSDIYSFICSNPNMKIYCGHTPQLPTYTDGKDYIEKDMIEELLTITRKLISGEYKGADAPKGNPIIDNSGIKVKVYRGTIMRDYFYNPERL